MKNKIVLWGIISVLTFTASVVGGETWWGLYFTDPPFGYRKRLYKNPESELNNLIKGARRSIYGAFYEISSPSVTESLIDAKNRGIEIKLVTEKDNSSGIEIDKLLRAGIVIKTDNRKGLMHNKFAIIDREIVWTGSYNITENGSKRNDNNAIKIRSERLAAIYLDEFNEMFYKGIFGNRKEPGPFARFFNNYYVKINGTNINAYFSPDNNIEKIIIKRIKKAKNSIHFMAFSFTSDGIGEAIIKKFNEGISVYGIFERKGALSRYSEYIKMKVEGLPVKLDKNRYMMHHKVIIIDKRVVITGSYNFSKNANRVNDENILIIDNIDIAGKYLREFYRLYR